MFKKHWITLLGAFFTFLAFVYLFKFAVDEGWISNQIKIGIGVVFGLGFFVAGVGIRQKEREILGQILNGLGVALLYTTFSFAGVYYDIWSPMTVFWAMTGVTLGTFLYSYKFDARMLINIALVGALVSPFVLKSRGDQVFTLFLYLLVVNAFYFAVSINKHWIELRLISFWGTWALFLAYYIHFMPETWMTPFVYAACAYLFFIISFMVSSLKENVRFNGLNLCLGLINAGIFSFWTLIILRDVIDISLIFAGMGLIYIITSAIMYIISGKFNETVITNFFGGLLFLLIASSEFGKGMDIKPLISVYTWSFIAIVLLVIGQLKDIKVLKIMSAVLWILTGAYWYMTTWEAPLGMWFGTFIPILNWSGMAWVVLAAIGFYFSINVKFSWKSSSIKIDDKVMSNFFAVISHLIVGGLLTFQIDNIFEEYMIKAVDLWLTLSITWGLYALILFLWGAYSKQRLFRWFGSAVLIVVSIKTIFIDLSNAEIIYKVLVLFALSLITFGISYVNTKWKNEDADEVKAEEVQLELREEVLSKEENITSSL